MGRGMGKGDHEGGNAMEHGTTLWLTGLPCSGKTTLAHIVEGELRRRGNKVEILDGDVIRTHLSKGLGFSREDRETNLRRIGFVAKLLTRNGVIAIVAAVSPHRDVRDAVRADIKDFVEVHVKCPVDLCITRDVKGMYRLALEGQITEFTGISDPYEEPLHPEIVVETDREAPEESAARIVHELEKLSVIPPIPAPTSASVTIEPVV
jgi:adenylyl-sulfate kinase